MDASPMVTWIPRISAGGRGSLAGAVAAACFGFARVVITVATASRDPPRRVMNVAPIAKPATSARRTTATPARFSRRRRRSRCRRSRKRSFGSIRSWIYGIARGVNGKSNWIFLQLAALPAEADSIGPRRQRARREARRWLRLVVTDRCHIVRRIRVKEGGEVLDLPSTRPELELPAAVHGDSPQGAEVVDLEQRA